MKATYVFLLTMSWAMVQHGTGYAVLLRAEPALECGSGAAAFAWRAGLYEISALSPLGERAARGAVFISGRGTGEGVPTRTGLPRHSMLSRKPFWGEGENVEALSPLPWGGVPRPALSSAAAGRVRGRSGPAPEKVSRPEQFPNRQRRSAMGNATKFRQPGSSQSGAAANNGSLRNETVNSALAVRGPSVVRLTTPSFGNVRHRGPNPAVVNGAPRAHGSNTAAITGTRMTRRP